METKTVVLCEHDPQWGRLYECAAVEISNALGLNQNNVHHIGSTSIPDILAKPIIDILVEVTDLALVDKKAELLGTLGYEPKGEFGMKGRRYFRKHDGAGIRTHHVHIYETGSFDIKRHLAFRDFLCEHIQIAQEYSTLKSALLQDGYIEAKLYQKRKTPFITRVEKIALPWYESRDGEKLGA